MANSRPNMKLLRPNFNIKNTSQVTEQEPPQPTIEPKEVKPQEPKLNLKPFVRPPSSRKEDVRQSIQESQLVEDSKVSQQRRTPVNGFRKFNLQQPQQPQPQVEEVQVAQSQYQGPAINLFQNKEKIQQKVIQIQQEELRQKMQVKVQSKPLNVPDNIFKESNDGFDKKQKPIRAIREPIAKDTIKVSELLENNKQFQNQLNDNPIQFQPQSENVTQPQPNETIPKKVNRTRVKQPETIDIIKQNEEANIEIQPEAQPEVKETIPKRTAKTKSKIPNSIDIEKQNEQVLQNTQKEIIKQQQQPQMEDYIERQIKFSNTQSVSLSKLEQQKQRVKDLRQLITLEIDDYSNQIVIQPRSEYETYLYLIKGNALKNSCDQAFDDRITIETQTEEIQTNDFGGQCPEDQNRTFLNHHQKQQDNRLAEFLEQACEVVEELLNKNNSGHKSVIQQNNDFRLPQQINKIFKCKHLNIITHHQQDSQIQIFDTYYIETDQCKWLNGSLIIQYPQKQLYFTPSKITCLISGWNLLIYGNKDGQLGGWNMNQKGYLNKYIDKIEQLLNNELKIKSLNFATEWNLQILDQFSDINQNQMAQIQQISFQQTLLHEIISMDIFGNLQIWEVQDLQYNEQDKLYVELGIRSKQKFVLLNTIKQNNKINSNFTLDIDSILICGPTKVISIIQQKSYYDDSYIQPCIISNIYYQYFCVGYVDGHVALFHKNFTRSIWNMRVGLKKIIYLQILCDDIIAIIDKETVLYIYQISNQQLLIGRQLGDNSFFNYAFQQNDELLIIIRDKNGQLEILKERIELNLKRNEILDRIYEEYSGQ